MSSKKNIIICATLVFLFFACVPLTRAVDPVSAAPVNYAEILKANPMKAGEQSQAIKVAEDDTMWRDLHVVSM
ncbi:MAG: hypothetical protein ABSC55_29185 [Syntrophorhabdales bacterium]